MIVEQQEKESWGKAVVENIAKDIQLDFPGLKGFSSANLWRMRTLYIEYKNHNNLAPLVREISWAKNVVIFEKCKDDLEREFYLSVLNDKVKLADENPSIGIIICKEKNRLIVDYALKDTKQPIGITEYKITNRLP